LAAAGDTVAGEKKGTGIAGPMFENGCVLRCGFFWMFYGIKKRTLNKFGIFLLWDIEAT
jgi:hypothetical protein